MKVPFVDLVTRNLLYRDRYRSALDRVLSHGQAILGPEVVEFENAVSKFVKRDHVIAVANGTDALVLGLRALGITGGEVITTPMSYLASTSAIALAGAVPVFADVGPDLNLCAESVKQAITPETRAILVVHVGGNPAHMLPLAQLAKSKGLKLIEDCAQAFGAGIDSSEGNLSDIGGISFHPLKNLGAVGDAGAIFTSSGSMAEWLRLARNHGHSSRDQCEFWSVNSRMDSLQAGFLLATLENYPATLSARREQAQRYIRGLEDFVKFPTVNSGAQPTYNFLYVLADRRDALKAYLEMNGIETRIHYPMPIHRLNAARHLRPVHLPKADAYTAMLLSLPIGLHITDAQIDYVTEKIRSFYLRNET